MGSSYRASSLQEAVALVQTPLLLPTSYVTLGKHCQVSPSGDNGSVTPHPKAADEGYIRAEEKALESHSLEPSLRLLPTLSPLLHPLLLLGHPSCFFPRRLAWEEGLGLALDWAWARVQAQSDSLAGRQRHDSALSSSDRSVFLGHLAPLRHLLFGGQPLLRYNLHTINCIPQSRQRDGF